MSYFVAVLQFRRHHLSSGSLLRGQTTPCLESPSCQYCSALECLKLYTLDQEPTVAPYFLKICLMLKTSTNHSQVHTWYFLASPTSPAAPHFLVECLIPAPSISIPCSCHLPCNCSLTVAHASWYSG